MPGVVLHRDHLHCPSTARAQLLPLSLLPGLLCLLYQSLLVVSCLQRTHQLKKRAHGRYGGAANAAPTAFFPPRPLLRPGLDDVEPSKNITARGGPCPTCAQPCHGAPERGLCCLPPGCYSTTLAGSHAVGKGVVPGACFGRHLSLPACYDEYEYDTIDCCCAAMHVCACELANHAYHVNQGFRVGTLSSSAECE
eukprot:COSAG01_NODE_1674_length_9542_cov_35.944827_9_plen_195_part_00